MKMVMNIILSCAFLVGVISAASANSYLLRHPSDKKPTTNSIEPPSVGLGQHTVEHKVQVIPAEKDEKGRRLMDMISKFRAEVCYKMKQEHGMEFKTFKDCQKFMDDACDPGKDNQMDGDKKETTSGEGYCKEYFPQAEKKAKEQIEKEDEEAKKPKVEVVAPAPGPAPAPVVSGLQPAPAPAVAGMAPAAVAPAPGPFGAPGPAPGPVPGPFLPGITGGKPWGPIADDEKYYYAKDGKDPMRLHMSADLKLPTQGYWGKLVEHEDMKTVNEDWGHEFGPKSGHESFESICKEHPDSAWCQQNGYLHRHKSACSAVYVSLVPLVAAFATIGFF